jgi:signal transduction histidine kinase
MSHELRTPLNAIAGYAQLLEMGIHGALTGTQRTYLEKIRRNQEHLLGLINDVLNFARLEAGRVEYDVQPLLVRDVLADVAPLVQPQFDAKSIVFDVRLPEDAAPGAAPIRVLADREKLGQVLVNLLGNAAKFTAEGGRVLVTLDRLPDAAERPGRAPRVAVTVADTGIGIPRDKLPHVFDPFVQAHVGSAFTRQHEGSGLGLSISRDLVRGMSGELTVWSEVGVGTAFTLLLPAAD